MELTQTLRKGLLNGRIDRIAETGHMTVTDVAVMAVAGALGMIPDGAGSGGGPADPHEPGTWCSRCSKPYWGSRCRCGKV